MPRNNATPEELRRYIIENSEPVTESGCWIWTAGIFKERGGYGALCVNRRAAKAHRVSYEVFRGTAPTGKLVCHKCDVPSCVNPEHLFLGSYADNNVDKVLKGRAKARSGEAHPKAKLSESDVIRLRADFSAGGMTRRQLAKKYGVGKTAVDQVIFRVTWKNVI